MRDLNYAKYAKITMKNNCKHLIEITNKSMYQHCIWSTELSKQKEIKIKSNESVTIQCNGGLTAIKPEEAIGVDCSIGLNNNEKYGTICRLWFRNGWGNIPNIVQSRSLKYGKKYKNLFLKKKKFEK